MGVRLQETTPGDRVSFALVRRQELRPGGRPAGPGFSLFHGGAIAVKITCFFFFSALTVYRLENI